ALGADGDLDFADFTTLDIRDLMQASLQVYQVGTPETRVISVKGPLMDVRPWNKKPADKPAKAVRADAAALTIPEPAPSNPQIPTRVILDLDRLKLSGDGSFKNL